MRELKLPIFPPNRRAQEANLLTQLEKVKEEAQESVNAYRDGEGTERILEEVIDTLHALEGVLNKFDDLDIRIAIMDVLEKNTKREDYE